MEVKSGEGTVVVADRNHYSVEGVGKEVLNNRFATERGLCDLGYKTNSDIRDSRDQRDQNIINSVVQALGNKTA